MSLSRWPTAGNAKPGSGRPGAPMITVGGSAPTAASNARSASLTTCGRTHTPTGDSTIR